MPEPKHPRFALKLILPPVAPSGPPEPAAPVSEATAIREFIARVGNIENGRQALELWALLSSTGRKRPKAA